MSEYTHYIQKEGKEKVNLETYFGRILYSKCVGLDAKGKRKNVYEESFSESDELNIWIDPDGVTREATKITLTLCFIGEREDTKDTQGNIVKKGRQTAFDALYNYIKNGKIYYWDTARHKKAYCILKDEYKPSEEMWYGSTPYIIASITLQNLWGECKKCDDNGNLI
jgi:hypothetical protein